MLIFVNAQFWATNCAASYLLLPTNAGRPSGDYYTQALFVSSLSARRPDGLRNPRTENRICNRTIQP